MPDGADLEHHHADGVGDDVVELAGDPRALLRHRDACCRFTLALCLRRTLLRRLVDEHGLETEGRWIVLANDSTIPALTDSTRTLSLAGVPGLWAYPAADTLVGMKSAARRFRRRIERCPPR